MIIISFVCQRSAKICLRLQFTQSLSKCSITLLSISSSCFFSLRIYRRRKKEILHYSAAVHKLHIHTVFRHFSGNSIAILANIQIRNLQVRSFDSIMRFSSVYVCYRLRGTMKTTNESYYWS